MQKQARHKNHSKPLAKMTHFPPEKTQWDKTLPQWSFREERGRQGFIIVIQAISMPGKCNY